jgi:aminocarboxymuconate-semialdehyde decarboxylase
VVRVWPRQGRATSTIQCSSPSCRVEALDLPIFLRPQQTLGGKRLGVFYLSNFLGNPIDTAIAASHLIFAGVLDRQPKLPVDLPHAGGVLTILIGRIDQGWSRREETKHLAQASSTYLRRFTCDTSPTPGPSWN